MTQERTKREQKENKYGTTLALTEHNIIKHLAIAQHFPHLSGYPRL